DGVGGPLHHRAAERLVGCGVQDENIHPANCQARQHQGCSREGYRQTSPTERHKTACLSSVYAFSRLFRASLRATSAGNVREWAGIVIVASLSETESDSPSKEPKLTPVSKLASNTRLAFRVLVLVIPASPFGSFPVVHRPVLFRS